ncbi:MAG: hypothetical protein Q4F00_01760 [bacterium]|nr:hypothetical protein [bacterium]
MALFKNCSLICASASVLFALAVPAWAEDNEVRIQKITWVKPSQEIKVASPTLKAPELLEPNNPVSAVRQSGVKLLHPAPPKVKLKPAKAAEAEPISAVSPLYPEKPTVAKVLSSYYGIKTKDVDKAMAHFGLSDDALVALFMANASNSDLDRIIALRQGNSWKNVIGSLQLNTKYLFQNLQVGPIPKENTRNCMSIIQYMSWREEPEFRDLGDLSVRELVGASLIANRFQTGPLEAMRQVHESGSALAALQRYTKN